jgi:hypothetical protein
MQALSAQEEWYCTGLLTQDPRSGSPNVFGGCEVDVSETPTSAADARIILGRHAACIGQGECRMIRTRRDVDDWAAGDVVVACVLLR